MLPPCRAHLGACQVAFAGSGLIGRGLLPLSWHWPRPPGGLQQSNPLAKVRIGEVSRARQALMAPALAPGTEATYAGLTDPARRPARPRSVIPEDVLSHVPTEPATLAPKEVAAALREARRGGAPGLSGMRAKHLKLLLQDIPAQELLAYAATLLARARWQWRGLRRLPSRMAEYGG